MEEPQDYNQRLNELTDQVNSVTNINTNSFLSNIFPKNIKSEYIIMGVIPIIILIILIISKPSFIMYQKDKNEPPKLSMGKLILVIIISIAIEFGVYYFYLRKKFMSS
jgi:hypothetical protein